MVKPTAATFAARAAAFLGRSYADMDCRELINNMLRAVGVSASYKGSNAMWRDMAWTGTPEEAVAKFGRVPVGALLYIVKWDGGEVARGYTDGMGNASHVGVKTGTGKGAVHSSQSRGCVCESNFADRTIPNGGWNFVGLLKQVDYGEYAQETPETAPATSTASTTYTTLRKGDKGADVQRAQEMLLALGYDMPKYGADGDFGAETQNAVKGFQFVENLAIDGIIGPKTWAALEQAVSNVWNSAKDVGGEDEPEAYSLTINGLTYAEARELAALYADKNPRIDEANG